MKIIVIGNGGHSKVIQDMISAVGGHEIIAVLDDKQASPHRENGVIYAPICYTEALLEQDVKVVIAVGDNATRRKLAAALVIGPDQYVTVIHPAAVVSPAAEIGCGTVVMPGAVINAGAVVGEHCIINSGAIIEHDNSIGDYAHVSPNATLTGNVSIGAGVHIGASATVIPGISIGDWSVIGAGSTVIRTIPAHSKAVGSPTRIIKCNKGKGISGESLVM